MSVDISSYDQGQFHSRVHYLSERKKASYFHKVVQAYIETRSLQPLVAIDYDASVLAKRLGPKAIHYLADVELATKKALKTTDLFQQWQAFVNQESVNSDVRTRIVSACGAEYMRRKLMPSDYFRTIKRRPEWRKAAA